MLPYSNNFACHSIFFSTERFITKTNITEPLHILEHWHLVEAATCMDYFIVFPWDFQELYFSGSSLRNWVKYSSQQNRLNLVCVLHFAPQLAEWILSMNNFVEAGMMSTVITEFSFLWLTAGALAPSTTENRPAGGERKYVKWRKCSYSWWYSSM